MSVRSSSMACQMALAMTRRICTISSAWCTKSHLVPLEVDGPVAREPARRSHEITRLSRQQVELLLLAPLPCELDRVRSLLADAALRFRPLDALRAQVVLDASRLRDVLGRVRRPKVDATLVRRLCALPAERLRPALEVREPMRRDGRSVNRRQVDAEPEDDEPARDEAQQRAVTTAPEAHRPPTRLRRRERRDRHGGRARPRRRARRVK